MEPGELLLKKSEVFVYKIPERIRSKVTALQNYRAADWDISNPVWNGKLLVSEAGPECCKVELKDEENRRIYGNAILKEYPGKDLVPVSDSSRYFTLRVTNGDGNFELVGVGFAKVSESADFQIALRNYFDKIAAIRHASEALEIKPIKRLKMDVEKHSKFNSPDATQKLKCAFCTQKFESPAELIQHFQDTHAENANLANEALEPAPAPISTKTEDPEYKYISTDMGLFKCHICDETLSDVPQIEHHWRKSHSIEDIRSCECGLPFPIKEELDNHTLRFHSALCPICNKRFPRKGLDDHLLRAHLCNPSKKTIVSTDGRDFRCHWCDGWFSPETRSWKHRNHKNYKNKTLRLLCPEQCGEKYDTEPELKGHLSSAHNYTARRAEEASLEQGRKLKCRLEESEAKKKIKAPMNLNCDRCERSFRTLRDLRRHYDHDHPDGPATTGLEPSGVLEKGTDKTPSIMKMNCPVCGQSHQGSFGVRDHLKGNKHMDIFRRDPETGAFSCYKCQLEFNYKDHYLDHLIFSSSCSNNSHQPQQ